MEGEPTGEEESTHAAMGEEELEGSGMWLRGIEDISFEDDAETPREILELVRNHIEGLDRNAAKRKVLAASSYNEHILNHTREALFAIARQQRRDCPQGQPKKRTYRANTEPVANRLAEDCCALFQFIEGGRNLAEIKKMFPTGTQKNTWQSPAITRSRRLNTILEEGEDEDVVAKILAENASLREMLKTEMREVNEKLTSMSNRVKHHEEARVDVTEHCDRQLKSIQDELATNKGSQLVLSEDIESMKGKLKKLEATQVRIQTTVSTCNNKILSLETEIHTLQGSAKKSDTEKEAKFGNITKYVQSLAFSLEERIREQEYGLSTTHGRIKEMKERLDYLEPKSFTTSCLTCETTGQIKSQKMGSTTESNQSRRNRSREKSAEEALNEAQDEDVITTYLQEARDNPQNPDNTDRNQVNLRHEQKLAHAETGLPGKISRSGSTEENCNINQTDEGSIINLDPSPIRNGREKRDEIGQTTTHRVPEQLPVQNKENTQGHRTSITSDELNKSNQGQETVVNKRSEGDENKAEQPVKQGAIDTYLKQVRQAQQREDSCNAPELGSRVQESQEKALPEKRDNITTQAVGGNHDSTSNSVIQLDATSPINPVMSSKTKRQRYGANQHSTPRRENGLTEKLVSNGEDVLQAHQQEGTSNPKTSFIVQSGAANHQPKSYKEALLHTQKSSHRKRKSSDRTKGPGHYRYDKHIDTHEKERNAKPGDESTDLSDFVSAARTRLKRRRFFLGYMKKTEPRKLQDMIYKYAQRREVHLSFVRVMTSRQKDMAFARINVLEHQADMVVKDKFWPEGIRCRLWLSERRYKNKGGDQEPSREKPCP
ncbi:uncharacterized protein LOC144864685 [Branchiostoma floridae x Branchiostoma japonicum]